MRGWRIGLMLGGVLLAACAGAAGPSGAKGADGAAGAAAKVVVTAEASGANCASGGQKVESSVGSGPVTTAYVCNGAAGIEGNAANVVVTDEPAGANCGEGGKKISASSGDGAPVVSYVCDGADGKSAVAIAEPAGVNCSNGGVKVTSGSVVQFVCNGTNGVSGQGVVATAEPSGANCENGGVRLVSQSGTNYVCNGVEGDLLSVNAGADQTVLVGSTVTLAGSAASSVIGVRWSQFSGPTVTIGNPQSLVATFSAPASYASETMRDIVLKLEATDGDRIESDLVKVRLMPDETPGALVTKTIGGTTFEFSYVPGGTFLRGSPDSDLEAFADEKPQHTVTLTRGYLILRNEVTQSQYLALVGTNPSVFPGDASRPVENIT